VQKTNNLERKNVLLYLAMLQTYIMPRGKALWCLLPKLHRHEIVEGKKGSEQQKKS